MSSILRAVEQRLPGLIGTRPLDATTQHAVHHYVAGIRDCIAEPNQWHACGTRRYHKRATEHDGRVGG